MNKIILLVFTMFFVLNVGISEAEYVSSYYRSDGTYVSGYYRNGSHMYSSSYYSVYPKCGEYGFDIDRKQIINKYESTINKYLKEKKIELDNIKKPSTSPMYSSGGLRYGSSATTQYIQAQKDAYNDKRGEVIDKFKLKIEPYQKCIDYHHSFLSKDKWKKLLPTRKEKLKKVDIIKTDEELLNMDDKTFDKIFKDGLKIKNSWLNKLNAYISTKDFLVKCFSKYEWNSKLKKCSKISTSDKEEIEDI